jgi:hypothetical protein
MKFATAFTALAFSISPAWAYHLNSNADQAQSIINVHDSHFPHAAGDSHGPEKGGADIYGSVLLDGQSERHVPHAPGDSHAPEKGSGDAYGSVLNR